MRLVVVTGRDGHVGHAALRFRRELREQGAGALEAQQPGVGLGRDAELAAEALGHVAPAPTRFVHERLDPQRAMGGRQLTAQPADVGRERTVVGARGRRGREASELVVEETEPLRPRRRVSHALEQPFAGGPEGLLDGEDGVVQLRDVAEERRRTPGAELHLDAELMPGDAGHARAHLVADDEPAESASGGADLTLVDVQAVAEPQDESDAVAGHLPAEEADAVPFLVAHVCADDGTSRSCRGALRRLVDTPLGFPAGEDQTLRHDDSLPRGCGPPRLLRSSGVRKWELGQRGGWDVAKSVDGGISSTGRSCSRVVAHRRRRARWQGRPARPESPRSGAR